MANYTAPVLPVENIFADLKRKLRKDEYYCYSSKFKMGIIRRKLDHIIALVENMSKPIFITDNVAHRYNSGYILVFDHNLNQVRI